MRKRIFAISLLAVFTMVPIYPLSVAEGKVLLPPWMK
jgi:hypothetical protein